MTDIILATPRSFGTGDDTPIRMLRDRGYEVIRNPHGRVLNEAEMAALAENAAGVIVGVDPLGRAALERATKLRAVVAYGTGTDNIDLPFLAERGIPWASGAGVNADAVADYAFAMILALARKVVAIDAACRRGDWRKIMSGDVHGKTLGVVGFGRIGRAMARRAAGFSMTVLAYDPFLSSTEIRAAGASPADLEHLAATADFITLHLPENVATASMIGRGILALMKPEAFFINTARGGLVDESALMDALEGGKIAGAGLDVFQCEPPDDPRWFALNNVVFGSHCAASTDGAARAMGVRAAENMLRLLDAGNGAGQPAGKNSGHQ